MVARSGRASIEDWLQGGMQTETGFKSLGDQSPMLCCSRTLMDRRLKPSGDVALKCPRCDSANTKFCYYNNYSLTQPRYFCKTCRRYWTKGGSLRNVPVGGGCRKNKRGSKRSTADRTPATSRLQMNRTSSNSANSPSNIDNNNDVADCSPDNLDRRNGILPAVPSSVYYAVGLREGDGLGVAYPAVQHPRQHPAARATDQSGVAGNNNCSNSSSGMLICNGPEGPGLQSNLPPLVNLNAFQSLKSACSLLSALEPPQTTCNRSGADQGSALMDIRGDLSSIFDVARQNQQQIVTSSASAISHVSDANFSDAFNLVAGHGNGLNDVEWQKHQKQVMIPLEDDNGQINLLLPFDHRETAVKELETHADRQRTLRPLAVTTTTGLQQPLTLNNIYEQNRSAGYNWQGPNLSESLIPNETSGCLNTTYWNMGGAWPDLSCYGPN